MKTQTKRDASLDYLRVIAMAMVVLDHIAFLRRSDWTGTKICDFLFFKPLAIIQWAGAFGVCIFFLISGYLFVPSFNRRSAGLLGEARFTLRKLLGLWLPCVLAFAFFFVFQRIVGALTPLGRFWWQFSALDWIESATLVSFFIGSYDKINITWFLIPLVVFYLFYAHIQGVKIKEQYKIPLYGGGYY